MESALVLQWKLHTLTFKQNRCIQCKTFHVLLKLVAYFGWIQNGGNGVCELLWIIQRVQGQKTAYICGKKTLE